MGAFSFAPRFLHFLVYLLRSVACSLVALPRRRRGERCITSVFLPLFLPSHEQCE
jgi:hypothetical protein